MLEETASEVLELKPWRLQHTVELLCHHFSVSAVDPELTNLVFERSGGVPLFG